MDDLLHDPARIRPPLKINALPEPTVSIAGTELPAPDGEAVYRVAKSTTSASV